MFPGIQHDWPWFNTDPGTRIDHLPRATGVEFGDVLSGIGQSGCSNCSWPVLLKPMHCLGACTRPRARVPHMYRSPVSGCAVSLWIALHHQRRRPARQQGGTRAHV